MAPSIGLVGAAAVAALGVNVIVQSPAMFRPISKSVTPFGWFAIDRGLNVAVARIGGMSCG